jgi:hypothetical protein
LLLVLEWRSHEIQISDFQINDFKVDDFKVNDFQIKDFSDSRDCYPAFVRRLFQ